MHIQYKYYEASPLASTLSGIGAVCKAGALCCLAVSAASVYASIKFSKLDAGGIFGCVAGAILFGIGSHILAHRAENIGVQRFNERIKDDLKFAIWYTDHHPEKKEWVLSQNPEFARYAVENPVETEQLGNFGIRFLKAIPISIAIVGVIGFLGWVAYYYLA